MGLLGQPILCKCWRGRLCLLKTRDMSYLSLDFPMYNIKRVQRYSVCKHFSSPHSVQGGHAAISWHAASSKCRRTWPCEAASSQADLGSNLGSEVLVILVLSDLRLSV